MHRHTPLPDIAAARTHVVSVKGVVQLGDRFLLRQNERAEWELLGGKLELSDPSFADRLLTELREESGIEAEIISPLEPWLYSIGRKQRIIVPFCCRPVNIPSLLHDADGGRLAWIRRDDLKQLPMPLGYLDSIYGDVPRTSLSLATTRRRYREANRFKISVRVFQDSVSLAHTGAQVGFLATSSPRSRAEALAGTKTIDFLDSRLISGDIQIDYQLNTPQPEEDG